MDLFYKAICREKQLAASLSDLSLAFSSCLFFLIGGGGGGSAA